MPDWEPYIHPRLASLRLTPTREREIIEELSQHLEDRWRELVAGGTSEDEAMELALAGFRDGNLLARHLAPLRQAHAPEPITPGAPAGRLLSDLWQDARYAGRALLTQPVFWLAAIATLALGIGATTAIFSVVDGVLLRPLPFPDADRLAAVYMRFVPQNEARGPFSLADYLDLRNSTRSFDEIAAYSGVRLDLAGGTAPEQVAGVLATSNLFTVLGAHPIVGRMLQPGDDLPSAGQVMVLSEALWRRRFQADPVVVGKVVTAGGELLTVVGVMPASFAFPRADVEFWANMRLTPPTRRGPFGYGTIGRLRAGTTVAQAQAEATALAHRIEEAWPSDYAELDLPVVPLREALVGDTRPTLLASLAAAAGVLLIATVNVATLLLMRAVSRGREIAVRLSLGASRGRLVRQLLTESVLLALLGAAGGLVLTYAALRVVRATEVHGIPRIHDVGLDVRVLLFAVSVSIFAGLVFGLAPALQGVRASLTGGLRDGGRGATSSARHRRLHAALVIAEIALSLVLLIGAGLLVRSFLLLQRVETGVRAPAAEVITMRVSPNRILLTSPPDAVFDPDATVRYYDRLLARVRALPGVETVALAGALPPDRLVWTDSFVVDGQSSEEARSNPAVVTPEVTPDYFRALGVPLLRGRVFNERDTASSTPVAVISATMAHHYFAGHDPIGQHIKQGGPGRPDNPRYEIIGVVGDVKYSGLQRADEPVYYRAFTQATNARNFLVVRSTTGADIVRAVRREIQAFDPDAVVNQVATMDDALADSVAAPRFRMQLIGVFAIVALTLAAVGTYGVMAYAVAQRTQEIGLRMALGATRADMLRLVLGQTARLTMVGGIIGVIGALLLTRSMSLLLFGVETTDPVTFAGAAVGLATITLAVGMAPARRAMRIDPIVALRQDQ